MSKKKLKLKLRLKLNLNLRLKLKLLPKDLLLHLDSSLTLPLLNPMQKKISLKWMFWIIMEMSNKSEYMMIKKI